MLAVPNEEATSKIIAMGVKVGSDPVKAALVHVHKLEQSLSLLMRKVVAVTPVAASPVVVPHTNTPVPVLDKATSCK